VKFSTTVPGVLIVGAEATVRDYFGCADQSNPLYLQIAPTIKTPGTEYIERKISPHNILARNLCKALRIFRVFHTIYVDCCRLESTFEIPYTS